jgi:hypothetical protein
VPSHHVQSTRVAGIAFAFVLLLIAGCSHSTAPDSFDVSGTWGGSTCAPALIDSCSIELRLTQTGSSVSGTYNYIATGGSVQGSVSGSTVALTLTNPAGTGSACVQANLTQTEMIGAFLPGCGSTAASGSFDVMKLP